VAAMMMLDLVVGGGVERRVWERRVAVVVMNILTMPSPRRILLQLLRKRLPVPLQHQRRQRHALPPITRFDRISQLPRA